MASEITIYTDGASSGNPGPGGFGVVLISGRHRLEKSAWFRLTTNNRMELLAVIEGLEALKIPGSRVVIYTDSKYVADSVEKGWVFGWESKGFKKKKKPPFQYRLLFYICSPFFKTKKNKKTKNLLFLNFFNKYHIYKYKPNCSQFI